MNQLVAKARTRLMGLKGEKGQNTVEYLLMLTVVVGVVLAAGIALKKFMPGLFQQIQGMISGAANDLGK
jgi:Flp pilus assembly pilin Flp